MTLTHDELPSRPADGPEPLPVLLGLPTQAQAPLQRRRRAGAPTPTTRSAARTAARTAGAAERGVGTARSRHRRRRLALLSWKALVVLGGAVLLVVCSAMALGFVRIHPLGFGPEPAAPSAAVTGADGVYPGGPARPVPVTVHNDGASSFEITALHPDLSALPPGCPASAWRTTAPDQLPTVAAGGEATVTLPVALAADAPQGCQSLAVVVGVRVEGLQRPVPTATSVAPASAAAATGALRPASQDAQARLVTATLGTPGATTGLRGGQLVVVPVRPPAGPAPTAYEVSAVAADGTLAVLCAAVTAPCADTAAPAAAARRYVVSALLGGQWRRAAAALEAWTPPPGPTLAFAQPGSSRTALVVRAAAAASDYRIALFADGAGAPFDVEEVAAGSAAERVVQPPALGPGAHRFVAQAWFRTWRIASGTARLTVSAGGVASPGPVDPPPVDVAPPSVRRTATRAAGPEQPVIGGGGHAATSATTPARSPAPATGPEQPTIAVLPVSAPPKAGPVPPVAPH